MFLNAFWVERSGTKKAFKNGVAYAASFSARSWTGLFLPSVLIDLLLLQIKYNDADCDPDLMERRLIKELELLFIKNVEADI